MPGIAEIGEVRTHKDGTKWRKQHGGWELVKNEKPSSKKQEHKKPTKKTELETSGQHGTKEQKTAFASVADMDRSLRRKYGIPEDATKIRIVNGEKVRAEYYDSKNRLQKRYTPEYQAKQAEIKFKRVHKFAKDLPEIRKSLDQSLNMRGLPEEKVIALAIKLIDKTFIRIGSEQYAEQNGTYGAATLLKEHIEISGSKVRFNFIGKKSKEFDKEFDMPELAPIFNRLLKTPCERLFQYKAKDGYKAIQSRQINEHLKAHGVTAKDFRTYHASRLFTEFATQSKAQTPKERLKELGIFVKQVSEALNNTPGVCKNVYIDPMCQKAFLNGMLMNSVYIGKSMSQDQSEQNFNAFLDQINDAYVEGKALPIGTVRNWKSGTFKKVGKNNWQPVNTSQEETESKDSKTDKQINTKEFKAWFGDWESDPDNASKAVDENGKPLEVYHGTPSGGFSEFRDYQFFTPNRQTADRYTSPSASSRQAKKEKAKPQVYATYLNIRKPFDTRNDDRAKEIYQEFSQPDNGTEFYSYTMGKLTSKGLIDWMDFDELVQFMEEKGYIDEFDGFVLDEGGILDENGESIDRGISFVVKKSNQIKSSTDNSGDFSPDNPNIYKSLTIDLPSEIIDLTIEQKDKLIKSLTDSILLPTISKSTKKLHKKPIGEGGELHPVKEFRAMENAFVSLINFDDLLEQIMHFVSGNMKKSFNLFKSKSEDVLYKPDGQPFTIAELDTLDRFIEKYFMAYRGGEKALAIRSFLVGRLWESARQEDKTFTQKVWEDLPTKYKNLQLEYGLSRFEIVGIHRAEANIAKNISGIKGKTQSKVKDIILRSRYERLTSSQLRQRLFDEMCSKDGNLNRDWRRIAITESNTIANEGKVSMIPDMQWVRGVSHENACSWCLKNINNRILLKLPGPPPPYEHLDPESKEYKDIAYLWENAIWSGKSNINRSTSKNKRMVDENGELHIVPREHHERAMPGILCHIGGRCSWIGFYPDFMYIKEDGNAHYATDDDKESLEEHAKWYETFKEQENRTLETYSRVIGENNAKS